ncbi:hypothetical protein ABGB16_08430 [Micromonospora sp. B11E3]|uniref:hypothetical protein n=1 Tax=Micromonospora sp. B11E3 TaxID=3153562 RepID=UPI00325ECD89
MEPLLMTGGFMFMMMSNSLRVLMGMVMLVEMGGGMPRVAVFQMTMTNGNRNQRINGDRRDYFRYLFQTRGQIRQYAAEQQDALAWRHPDPESRPGCCRRGPTHRTDVAGATTSRTFRRDSRRMTDKESL